VAMLREHDVSIVITDLRMLGSDGIVLLDYIHNQGDEERLVFLCSGFLDESRYDLKGYRIERMIAKPFRLREELDYFRELLEKRRA